jgi:glutamate carboxypeptidase
MHTSARILALGALALLPLSLSAQTDSSDPYTTDVSIKAPAKPLSATEKKMVATVDAENAASLDFLKQLVDINSGTHNLQGVRDVANLIMPQLTALGFHTEFHPRDDVHRAGNILAVHPCPAGPGHCGKRILIIGHMDTVFEKDQPMQPYSIVPGSNGKTATGQGVMDMKGGLVIALYALRAMQAAGVLTNTEITVVFSGDEEASGQPTSISRKDMIDAAKQNDVALEFENTAEVHGKDYGSTARRGDVGWSIRTTGKIAHSSGIFSKSDGYGAIYEITRILDAFRTQLQEPMLTFSVGLIMGGTQITPNDTYNGGNVIGKSNVIPPTAYAAGDLRGISDEQVERVKAHMKEIVAQHLPGTGATITFAESYPSMPPTAGNRSLLRMMNTVNQSLGVPQMPELSPMQRGAGDVAFVAPYLDALAGTGPTGYGAHSPGETLNLVKQPLQTKRAAILMYRLSQTDPTKKLTDLYPAN